MTQEEEIEAAWRARYAEYERLKGVVRGAKLTRRQAQVLPDTAIVYLQHKEIDEYKAVGEVALFQSLDVWKLDEFDVHNVISIPVACLEAEEVDTE